MTGVVGSAQLVMQPEGKLGPVSDGRRALAAEAAQLPGAGAGHDGERLLRHAVLEGTGALEHEAAGFARDAPDDALEADEHCRAVALVHHEVFDTPLARDVAGE